MQSIGSPDTHHLSAAIGWIELGNFSEAKLELEKLSEAIRTNPDVLNVWWVVHASEGNWEAGMRTAEALVKVAPSRAFGWLHRAYALRRMTGGGLQAAWDALLPAFEKFPKEPLIPYNLSCYACQLNRLEDARKWFHVALKCGGPETIKSMALRDADLAPLWPEIKNL